MTKTGRIVFFLFIAIVGTYFLMIGISAAENFLAPVVVAILLSMLVLPLADKLEHWGVARGWSSFWSDLLLLIVTIFFFFIISAQIKLVADDWDEIRSKFEPRLEKVLDYIHTKTGVSLSKQFNLDEYLGTGEKQGNSNTKQAKQNNSEKENNQSAIDKKRDCFGGCRNSGRHCNISVENVPGVYLRFLFSALSPKGKKIVAQTHSSRATQTNLRHHK